MSGFLPLKAHDSVIYFKARIAKYWIRIDSTPAAQQLRLLSPTCGCRLPLFLLNYPSAGEESNATSFGRNAPVIERQE